MIVQDPIPEAVAICEESKRKMAEEGKKKQCPMIVQDRIPEAVAIREESKRKKAKKDRQNHVQ